MANPKPKIADGVILFATICMMGAQNVLGPHLSDWLGQLLFYGGAVGMIVYVGWRLGPWAFGRFTADGNTDEGRTNNKDGIYVGRDNTGQQTIIHGPVTIHNALPPPHPPIPAPPRRERVPFSNVSQTVRSYEKPNLARHTLHGETIPIPDWPIHDLFFHIRPGLLENAPEHRWEIVARDIMDRLSTSQLVAWGREIDSRSKCGGALTLIPPDYWRNRVFIFNFFGPNKGVGKLNGAEMAHTYSFQDPKALQYADVRVNQAQALGIWPQSFIDADSPLEIIFDTENPARRFWSMESPRDVHGNKKPGVFWEYRVEIKNKSSKTIRNVSVTIEHIGQMPLRPTDTIFDKIGKTTCDLKPGCSELAPIIRWPIPIRQEGMLAGPTALEYGPIVIIASGDDVIAATRRFKFDYQAEPMIFE